MFAPGRRTRVLLAACVWCAVIIVPADSHSRLGCPPSRSPDTNIKSGPCGAQTGDFTGPTTTVAPGLFTIKIEESIAHTGAPFRIALSNEEDDSKSCVLLDHIPANPASKPQFGQEATWTPYYVTVVIPDVQCNKCSLQLQNPMTDKIGGRGWKECTYPGPAEDGQTCFSVYHSCANIKITGSIPRNQYTCDDAPTGWINVSEAPLFTCLFCLIASSVTVCAFPVPSTPSPAPRPCTPQESRPESKTEKGREREREREREKGEPKR